MGVLSKERILDRLNRHIRETDSLVITPLLQGRVVLDVEAIDLRLGTHFLLPQLPPQPFFYPGTESSTLGYQRVHIPLGRYLVVPAHQTVLGATLEFIKLPHDISGQILTKSSVARTFVVIETAPWIHPEYRGCLTLEIANVSNTPLLLYPGRLVAQLILFDVPGATASAKWSGTYTGPVYPEAPKFLDPRQDLESIGVRDVRKPGIRMPLSGRCTKCLAKLVSSGVRCPVCGLETLP